MRSSLLNNLCNDNNVQNQLFFFTFTNFLNYFYKNNPVEILTSECPLLKSVITLKLITFERDKSITSIEAFQDCYMSSFNEENLHFRSWSKLFVFIA